VCRGSSGKCCGRRSSSEEYSKPAKTKTPKAKSQKSGEKQDKKKSKKQQQRQDQNELHYDDNVGYHDNVGNHDNMGYHDNIGYQYDETNVDADPVTYDEDYYPSDTVYSNDPQFQPRY